MHESPIEINKMFKIKMTNSKTNKNSYNLYHFSSGPKLQGIIW